jgi:hypothetical protein
MSAEAQGLPLRGRRAQVILAVKGWMSRVKGGWSLASTYEIVHKISFRSSLSLGYIGKVLDISVIGGNTGRSCGWRCIV